jgi:hypothetical protein
LELRITQTQRRLEELNKQLASVSTGATPPRSRPIEHAVPAPLSSVIRRSLDETIERRIGSQEEAVRAYLTTDPVLVEDDYADTQLAETFLHHRVMVVPIATEGRVHAVVTRSEFFQALYDRIADIAEDFGD